MNIYAIDDERLALNALVRAIEQAIPEAVIHSFSKPSDLIAAIPTTACDIAFLDIHMPGVSGMELAKQIKAFYPKVNIIFVTGFTEHGVEAMHLRASGYVMKPVTAEKVTQELQALRYPMEPDNGGKKLFIRCFGNFEVFAGEKQLVFRRSKTKELLAYLVNRMGSNCTMGELMAALWEDREDTDSLRTQLRVLISDLRAVLTEVGAADVLVKSRNMIAINVNAVNCDYYNYLNDTVSNFNLYRGEYMTQYSWGEYTNARLLRD